MYMLVQHGYGARDWWVEMVVVVELGEVLGGRRGELVGLLGRRCGCEWYISLMGGGLGLSLDQRRI